MQRSRRALLQRRAVEKGTSGRNQLYKVSLSLVFVLWGLLFLFSLWISHGHSYRDGSEEIPVGTSNWDEAKIRQDKNSDAADKHITETDAYQPSEALCTIRVKDEFKSRAFSSKIKTGTGAPGNVIHRLEPGGAEYNYASASKGAKVLASNKEAKGASNILSRDQDKYLRSPCSAEEKFVIIELSEETLVDTIEIANFEHYSSNLRDFELLGSLVYPTDTWVSLGNFTAANVKHAQRFVLQEPKWIVPSYLGKALMTRGQYLPLPNHAGGEDMHQNTNNGMISNHEVGSSTVNSETLNNNVLDPVEEIRQQVGRLPGDTALKILMQKVRSLDINLSVLERYLEELNYRYAEIFKEYNKDIGEKDLLLQKNIADIRSLLDHQEVIAKDADDLISWKSLVSMQLDNLVSDNDILRSEVEKVRENQSALENKVMVVFLVCFVFSLLAIVRLFLDISMGVYRVLSFNRTVNSGKFCSGGTSRLFLLCSCTVVIFVISF
ncbi:Galactose-binding domain-like protein [Quillaja saponaria]|uniref:Galactose-binding domain-like protein n=1 Tax=Quillaja saponaria TaxID=32244 RepID=A0AAD7PBN3_QUISA|nr:Galactose-binding domain-like protein [Quillaja saponaria]